MERFDHSRALPLHVRNDSDYSFAQPLHARNDSDHSRGPPLHVRNDSDYCPPLHVANISDCNWVIKFKIEKKKSLVNLRYFLCKTCFYVYDSLYTIECYPPPPFSKLYKILYVYSRGIVWGLTYLCWYIMFMYPKDLPKSGTIKM